jgi:hypothetical protein
MDSLAKKRTTIILLVVVCVILMSCVTMSVVGVFSYNAYTQTNPPATNPPATIPPATIPPATIPPATIPPATRPPTTNPPATRPPTTNPPATNPPVKGQVVTFGSNKYMLIPNPRADQKFRCVQKVSNSNFNLASTADSSECAVKCSSSASCKGFYGNGKIDSPGGTWFIASDQLPMECKQDVTNDKDFPPGYAQWFTKL